MFQKFRSFLFFILFVMGLGLLFKRFNRKKYKVPILLFHRVSDLYDPYTEPLGLGQFESILKFFMKRYEIRSLNDLFSHGRDELKNSCYVVFDDALYDFFENGWPILEKLKVPVTLFVPTDAVSSQKLYWSLLLISYFIDTEKNFLSISIENCDKIFSLNGKKKIQTFHVIHDILMKSDIKIRDKLLADIKNGLSVTSSNSYFKTMNWDNIKILHAKGLDVQSHTKSHAFLPILKDDSIEIELHQSKIDIAKQLNTYPNALSYPYGGYNDQVVRKVSGHYKFGYITDNKLLDLNCIDNDERNRMVLSRINVTDKSPYELFFRINGFHSMIKSLFKSKPKRYDY